MAENTIYLTVDRNPKGKGLIAVMSRGSPQLGDENILVLSVEVVKNMSAAKKWFNRMKIEQPWETRS